LVILMCAHKKSDVLQEIKKDDRVFSFPVDVNLNSDEYFWIMNDKPSMGLFEYLIENENSFFNKMARDLSKKEVASRRTLFGRLLRLENEGILLTDMRHMTNYGEDHIQRWVKEYKIAEKHLPWIRQRLSMR